MSQEQHPPDGVPTHGPAPGPSLLSTASASATTTAPSTAPISVPAPADILGTPTTSDTTIITNTDRRRATNARRNRQLGTHHIQLPPNAHAPSHLFSYSPKPIRLERQRLGANSNNLHPLLHRPPRSPLRRPSLSHHFSSSISSSFLHHYLLLFLQQQSTSTSTTGLITTPRKAYQYLLFSGHSGLLTRSLTGDPFSSTTTTTPTPSKGDTRPQAEEEEEDKQKFQSEASIFASIALSMGVPPSAILIEEQSTNTGENVRFTHALLEKRGINVKDFLLVQKPYMERRTWGTFGRQWPSSFCSSPSSSFSGGASGAAGVGMEGEDEEKEEIEEDEEKEEKEEKVNYSVTSPPLEWEEYPDEESGNGRELVINVMVGDLVRIKEYGEKGWQVKMEIPENVWEAGRRLVEEEGYGEHLPEGFWFV
ncbi:DUF218 domain-containing protein [Neurospora hispaniola]|uniref:DUF218 domain-containing protein n=1 Tax=Neurospora hispaniola TaxID=588809 RepID=A0AAJ0HZU7_9PEZI|nr:DUF218 domain-containing protein [Neurospora hispaniola]